MVIGATVPTDDEVTTSFHDTVAVVALSAGEVVGNENYVVDDDDADSGHNDTVDSDGEVGVISHVMVTPCRKSVHRILSLCCLSFLNQNQVNISRVYSYFFQSLNLHV